MMMNVLRQRVLSSRLDLIRCHAGSITSLLSTSQSLHDRLRASVHSLAGNELQLRANLRLVSKRRMIWNRRHSVHSESKPLTSKSVEEHEDKEEDNAFPTIEDAKALPLAYRKMDNVSLVTLAGMGQHSARREVLIRHIMAVDEVPYGVALETFQKIREANFDKMYLLGLPFQIGAASMIIGGLACLPLVFHLGTVEWFNQTYVTADVPPKKDLETWLEVGAWSWNWMEPLLGTGTFVLLCVQYFRINMDHLGIKPYTHRIKQARAHRLVKLFPKYDREVLMNYSETATIYSIEK